MAGEVFISYRRSDVAHARRLHELLKAEGVDAWYDAQVGAGQDWRAATAAALSKSTVFVLLFSKAAAASDDIAKELAAATFSKKLVVPVRIENIQPEGPFLYELASRNWIDAWEDTDARLADLAKNLAPVVKQGVSAQSFVQVERGQPGSTRRKPRWRIPAVIAAGVVVAGALVAGGMAMLGGGDGAGPIPGRIAFFGIEAPAGDADAAAAAEATANTIRTTFAAMQQDVAASADTSNIPAKERLDRALKLRAQYAVSGVATRRGDTVSISVLVEDAPSRTTLWPAPFEGKASNPEALGSKVAALLADRMVCILSIRSSLRRDDIRIASRLPDACASVRTALPDPERWQALVDLVPDSAWAQSGLAIALYTAVPAATPTAVDDLWRRGDAALARAQAIDPDLPENFTARVRASRIHNESLVKAEAIYLEGLKTGRRAPNLNGQYSAFLWRAGRLRDTGSYLKQGLALDPLSPPKILATADYIARTGGPAAEAEKLFAQRHAQFPDGSEWQAHLIAALFHRVGDVDAVLADRPQGASDTLAACLTDLVRLTRSKARTAQADAIKRLEACRSSGAMEGSRANEALAFLGSYDATMTLAEIDPSFRVQFDPALPALRAHPSFATLMQQGGMVDYWRESGHPPDFCATEKAPVCALIAAR